MSTNTARTVVIAIDGSECANFAFNWFIKHIYRHGDHVVLVHCPEYQSVVHSSFVAVDVNLVAEQMSEQHKKTKEFVDSLGEKLRECRIGGKVKSKNGSAGEVIVEVAEEEGAAMIITGTRGLGTIRRTFLGSVSDYILHHARMPVIVCRHDSS